MFNIERGRNRERIEWIAQRAVIAVLRGIVPSIALSCFFMLDCNNNLLPGTIQGKVTNATGDTALAGAVLTTSPATDSVRTDSLGNYMITSITPGQYRVTAFTESRMGYYDPGSVTVGVASGQTATADIHLSHADKQTLIAAAGSSFQMGSTNGEADEQPVHTVSFAYDFYMDTTEVTQADYSACMGVNPSFFTVNTRQPVEDVTWFDAVLYCNARSKRDNYDTVYSYTSIVGTPGDSCTDLTGLTVSFEKNGYRLPAEAEWEYACRAGTTNDYYWGKNYPLSTQADWDTMDHYVVWEHNLSCTAAVGTRLPNAFGLYDMEGNAFEWCNDWYGSYTSGGQTDPTGPSNGTGRVLRGGSWNSQSPSAFRCAARFGRSPDISDSWVYGFRCVRR